MRKLTTLITGIILTISLVNGQSLRSAKSDIHKRYVTKYGVPRHIIEYNTFYNNSGIVKKKEIIEFSESLDTIIETRYKDNILDAQLMFVFNFNKQLIFRSFKNKVPLFGWQYEKSNYTYDENGLAKILTTNGNSQLKTLAIVECDTLGNPTTFKLYDGNKNLIGFETGEYFYDTNKWNHCVFNRIGELLSEEELTIEAVKSDNKKYNAQGDCVLYPGNWSVGNKIYYQVEYKYDELGNWTKQKIYKVAKVKNKLTSKRIYRKFKRKIKYKN